VLDALGAAHREPPDHRPSDEHRACAEGKGDRHVCAPSDPAVHQHLDPIADGVRHLREGVEGGDGAVELPAAVVGDHDGVAAMLGREDRIVCGEDSLRDHRQLRVLVEPLEVAPREPRVDEPRGACGRNDAEIPERRCVDLHPVVRMQCEPCAQVALPRPEDREVDGKDDRREPRLLRLPKHLLRHLSVRMPVELEPAAAFGRVADLGRARRCERGKAHQCPGGGRAAGDGELAVAMRHALVGDRRRHDRHRELGPEHRGRRRDVADVDEDARSQAPAVERLDIPADRVLVACASREVTERRLVEPLFGEALVVPDVQRVSDVRHAGENTAL